ncbi:hypothetical protein ACFTTN_03315 [Streptomyces niveus]|uniref:hypothetical protein n=1 Tax=Streptomyces niveus TaxID=193462 RepID=UPI00362D6A64
MIGVARLSACHQDPDGSAPCTEWAEPGRWHRVLDDAREPPLPIPARGKLGPWKPTEDLVGQVLQQLPGMRP